VFVLLVGVVGLMFTRMPNSFLPNEDQGYIIANIQLPPGATLERTNVVLRDRRRLHLKQPEVANMVACWASRSRARARTWRSPSSR
jgi:multidrug efflux pump